MRKQFLLLIILILFIGGILTYTYPPAVWVFGLIIPFTLLGIYDIFQTRHTLWRNFPVIGHTRWLMEDVRPMVQQYFVESELDGSPRLSKSDF